MRLRETMRAPLGQHPADRGKIFDLFRRWGYLQASLDPLGHLPPELHPDLELSGKAADEAHTIYCGPIGAEFMHLPQAERRLWVQQCMEEHAATFAPASGPHRLLQPLIRSAP